MCGRYLISTEVENIEMLRILAEVNNKYFSETQLEADPAAQQGVSNLTINPSAQLLPSSAYTSFQCGEIFPGSWIPVRTIKSSQSYPVTLMRWGFPFVSGNKFVRSVINARSETIHQKKMFAQLVQHNRCIIPANGFYEWDHIVPQNGDQHSGGKEDGIEERVPSKSGTVKRKYRIIPRYPSPYRDKSFFYMAGLFNYFKAEKPPENSGLPPQPENAPYVVILTTDASPQMKHIHNRMPVILTAEDAKTWLSDMSIEAIINHGLLQPWKYDLDIS